MCPTRTTQGRHSPWAQGASPTPVRPVGSRRASRRTETRGASPPERRVTATRPGSSSTRQKSLRRLWGSRLPLRSSQTPVTPGALRPWSLRVSTPVASTSVALPEGETGRRKPEREPSSVRSFPCVPGSFRFVPPPGTEPSAGVCGCPDLGPRALRILCPTETRPTLNYYHGAIGMRVNLSGLHCR